MLTDQQDTPIEFFSEDEEQPKKPQKKSKAPVMSTGGCQRCNAWGMECFPQKVLKGTVCVVCVKVHVLCTMAGEDGEPWKKKTWVEVVIPVTRGSGLSWGPRTTEAVLLEVMREMAQLLDSIMADVAGLSKEVYGVREDRRRAKRTREEEVQTEEKAEKEGKGVGMEEVEKEEKGVGMEEAEKEKESEEETMEQTVK